VTPVILHAVHVEAAAGVIVDQNAPFPRLTVVQSITLKQAKMNSKTVVIQISTAATAYAVLTPMKIAAMEYADLSVAAVAVGIIFVLKIPIVARILTLLITVAASQAVNAAAVFLLKTRRYMTNTAAAIAEPATENRSAKKEKSAVTDIGLL